MICCSSYSKPNDNEPLGEIQAALFLFRGNFAEQQQVLTMAYKFQDWKTRHRQRADLTVLITHLTREAVIDGAKRSAVEILAKIISERRIIGSTWQTGGFIAGNRSAVCFQAAPLLGLAENIRYEQQLSSDGDKVRYTGVGIAFNKHYAFVKGARPVIYERTDVAKQMLPSAEWWRIVNLNLSDPKSLVDWTHEREWRSPDDFSFELKRAVLIVHGTPEYRELLERISPDDLRLVQGVTVLGHAIA
jgi:hypothetical protein